MFFPPKWVGFPRGLFRTVRIRDNQYIYTRQVR